MGFRPIPDLHADQNIPRLSDVRNPYANSTVGHLGDRIPNSSPWHNGSMSQGFNPPSPYHFTPIVTPSTKPNSKLITRTAFNNKFTWDGKMDRFLEVDYKVNAWALQTNIDYLLDADFVASYRELLADNPSENSLAMFISRRFGAQLSYYQFVHDKRTLFGALMSICSKGAAEEHIIPFMDSKDGILCWARLKRRFKHKGNVDIQKSKYESELETPWTPRYPGGLVGYVDKISAAEVKLASIESASEVRSDAKKRRHLFGRFKHDPQTFPTVFTAYGKTDDYESFIHELRTYGQHLDQGGGS